MVASGRANMSPHKLYSELAVCFSPSRCTLMESMRFTTSMLKPNWLQIKLSRHIRHVAIQHANQAHIRPTSALTHRSTSATVPAGHQGSVSNEKTGSICQLLITS